MRERPRLHDCPPGRSDRRAGHYRQHVRVGTDLEPRGTSRATTWRAVLLAVLEEPGSVGKTFELVSGDTPIEEAVRSL